MLSFITQRIAKGVVVLLAIIVLNFFLIRLAPGDPAIHYHWGMALRASGRIEEGKARIDEAARLAAPAHPAR